MKPGPPAFAAHGKESLGTALGARLARGGVIVLAIRMASVALSYFMFVVLARHMSTDSFGQFGFAFSLATFLAIVAALGQPILVLRLIPVYQEDGKHKLLAGLIRDSRVAVLLGGLVGAGLMLVGAAIWNGLADQDVSYLAWTAFLIVAMALARHQAYVMRAFGSNALALAPRDIFWRIAVIACVFFIAMSGSTISASFAINICSITLATIFVIQCFAYPATRLQALLQPNLETDRTFWAAETSGIWGVTIAQAAGPNLSVVVLGLVLAPEETGPFFAALKTATLLTLPLAAGAIVGAPLISRSYHAGQIGEMQKLLRYLVIGITAPVLVGFAVILFLGDWILGLFGPGFVSAKSVLAVVAFGTLVNALAGPTGYIMNMTGHHRQYLSIMIVTQLLFLMILPAAAYYFGMLGAAVAVSAGMVAWNVWVWRWSRVNLSVDPTIYGVLEWLLGRQQQVLPSNEKA